MKPQDLYTRARSNEGIRMPLFDDGKPTDYWLLVRGLDSDAYREAHDATDRAMRRLAQAVRMGGENATLPPESKADKDAAKLAERVALIAGWNLEGECTPAAVEELLKEAPYLSDQVYYVAQDRDRFLGRGLQDSTVGQHPNSGLAGQQPPTPNTP